MKNVSAAIFLNNDSVLIAQRGDKENLAGYWEFPGGKQESNETIFECLEREIKEEFNIHCKANQIFYKSVYTYESGTINLIAIFADLKEYKELELKVHKRYEWVEITHLLNYKLAPADIPIAEKLIEIYIINSEQKKR